MHASDILKHIFIIIKLLIMLCHKFGRKTQSIKFSHPEPLMCRDWINPVQHTKYHGSWCPGSLWCQDTGQQHSLYWLCKIGKFENGIHKIFLVCWNMTYMNMEWLLLGSRLYLMKYILTMLNLSKIALSPNAIKSDTKCWIILWQR